MDTTRVGATWTRTAAFWAGQTEENTCHLCKEAEETADHIWRCKALDCKRKEIDRHPAEINPDDLPKPIRHGIAPAMKANPYKTFWGSHIEGTTIIQDKWMGVRAKNDSESEVAKVLQKISGAGGECLTARQLAQYYV